MKYPKIRFRYIHRQKSSGKRYTTLLLDIAPRRVLFSTALHLYTQTPKKNLPHSGACFKTHAILPLYMYAHTYIPPQHLYNASDTLAANYRAIMPSLVFLLGGWKQSDSGARASIYARLLPAYTAPYSAAVLLVRIYTHTPACMHISSPSGRTCDDSLTRSRFLHLSLTHSSLHKLGRAQALAFSGDSRMKGMEFPSLSPYLLLPLPWREDESESRACARACQIAGRDISAPREFFGFHEDTAACYCCCVYMRLC